MAPTLMPLPFASILPTLWGECLLVRFLLLSVVPSLDSCLAVRTECRSQHEMISIQLKSYQDRTEKSKRHMEWGNFSTDISLFKDMLIVIRSFFKSKGT